MATPTLRWPGRKFHRRKRSGSAVVQQRRHVLCLCAGRFGNSSSYLLESGDFTGDGRADLAVVGTDTSTGDDELEALSYNSDDTFHARRRSIWATLVSIRALMTLSWATSPATAGRPRGDVAQWVCVE